MSTLEIAPHVNFLMMRISIDDVEHHLLFMGISYCEYEVCAFFSREAHTLSYILFTYEYSKTLMELQIYVIGKLLMTIF